MRFFLPTVIVSSLALFFSTSDAAAISLNKRAAANVEACVVNINAVSTQLDILNPSIQSGSIIDARGDYQKLQESIKSAQATCCSISSVISDADASYYLDSFATVDTKAINLLSLATQKVNDYNFLVKLLVEAQINDLDNLTTNLDTCFTVFTPQGEKSRLDGYMNDLKNAFTSTRAAYGI